MSTYVVGDLQGCLDPLRRLLDQVNFDSNDKLWVAGDLVNRGAQSLECLRFIRDLGDQAITVLGNHDFHLLSIAYVGRPAREGDTLERVLNAPDCDELLHWLRHRKLAHYEESHNTFMAHAGLSPDWSVKRALKQARWVESLLQSDDYAVYLELMYGNEPRRWKDCKNDVDKLRYSVNAFARMRYCKRNGALSYKYKGPPAAAPEDLRPWFKVKKRKTRDVDVVFGHWSAIGGKIYNHAYPIDTGCVWGGKLTLMHLEEKAFTQVLCNGGRYEPATTTLSALQPETFAQKSRERN